MKIQSVQKFVDKDDNTYRDFSKNGYKEYLTHRINKFIYEKANQLNFNIEDISFKLSFLQNDEKRGIFTDIQPNNQTTIEFFKKLDLLDKLQQVV